jgi:SAM-dependent methyltransferase
MKSMRFRCSAAIVKLINMILGPFRRIRGLIIKTLIMVEKDRPPEESLRWLLDIHGFVETWIDNQCVAWGNGVHVKHEIMDGIHSFFYQRIPAGAHVLDVGCGIGAVAYAIACHTDATVTGMDLNEERIKFAQNTFCHPKLRFLVGDATRDLPPESVDVIVFSSVLEHIVDRPLLLRTLVDRYDPSVVLIRVPGFERHYHAALKKRLGLFAYTDPDHKTEYTVDSFLEEMQKAGMDVSYCEVRWGDIWAECVPRLEGGRS